MTKFYIALSLFYAGLVAWGLHSYHSDYVFYIDLAISLVLAFCGGVHCAKTSKLL